MQGDDPDYYQPPTFMFAFSPTVYHDRIVTWLPWYNGNPRAPGSTDWVTYDAMTTGIWYIASVGTIYYSFAEMVAANPDMTFMSDEELATYLPDYPGRTFNVGLGNYGPDTSKYFSSTRGGVDWFDVGIDGDITRWDLNEVVPEPGSMFTLLAGLVGLAHIVRRRG
jgi:hypothetical protein